MSVCVIYSCVSQNLFDNFDTYDSNQYLGVESNRMWTAWGGQVGGQGDVLVTNIKSYSGDNSVKFMSQDSVDLVLPLGQIKTGHWSLSFMMLVEANYGAYFNVLHEFNEKNESNWAFEVYFSSEGKARLNVANSVVIDFNYPVGEWFPVRLDVDVDENSGSLSVDNIPVGNIPWAWCLGTTEDGLIELDSTIAALNFVSALPTGETYFYVDDVGFKQLETANVVGVYDLDESVRLYPNPTSNQFFLEKNTSEPLELNLYSSLGRLIYRKKILSNLETYDCSTWAPGVYFVECRSKTRGIKTTKLIVK